MPYQVDIGFKKKKLKYHCFDILEEPKRCRYWCF
jgi:hypothetical protein